MPKKINTNVHANHRERMRDRIRESGLSSLQEHEVLEYILYGCVPQKNTNFLAHELIETFGSLSAVLNADEEHLFRVKDMTKNAALFLTELPEVFRLYTIDMEKRKEDIGGRGNARSFLQKKMFGCRVEEVYVAGLDAQDKLIKFEKLSSGSGNSVAVGVREVVDFAMRTKACGIILAHNHPSGNMKPSQNDMLLTRELMFTLESLDIALQDHYIFCDNQSYSFDENGYMDLLRKEKTKVLKDGLLFYTLDD